MRVLIGEGRREPVLALVVVLVSVALLAVAVVWGSAVEYAVPILGLILLLAVAHKQALAWRSLLALLILVILFIPIRRYSLPAGLPFQLEVYRLLVAFVFVAWLTSLLIDPRLRLRASGLEPPLLLFLFAISLSLVVNQSRVDDVGGVVAKALTFFISFLIVFYLVVSLAHRRRQIDFLVSVLAGGGAVVAFFAIIESSTGYNVFNHLHSVFPILQYDGFFGLSRGGRLRAAGSAQHPIALGAALAMLIPLAIYRARGYGKWQWWLITILLLFGLLATRSRTAIVMLFAELIVYVLLRPQSVKRLWPAILPMLVLVHVALPGTIGSFRASFFPEGGIIAQQQNASVGSGRLATLGPALDTEFKQNPLLGEGFGTRISTTEPGLPPANGPILDDQWLGVLLETGVAGTLALVWLFLRSMRRMGRVAKVDLSPRGWLLTGTTASVAGYALGMFTYDAFSFIQVSFLLFIILALGVATLRSPKGDWETGNESGKGESAVMGSGVPAVTRGV